MAKVIKQAEPRSTSGVWHVHMSYARAKPGMQRLLKRVSNWLQRVAEECGRGGCMRVCVYPDHVFVGAYLTLPKLPPPTSLGSHLPNSSLT